jgi:tripartite ATP-independent transporter DctM subunit
MELWQTSILIWGSMAILIFLGVPIAYSLGSVAIFGSIYVWGGFNGIFIIGNTAAEVMTNWVLLAIPLFILMGELLRVSGVAEKLFDLMHKWMGRLGGGLAIGICYIGAMLGAMMGAAPASTAMMCSMGIEPMLDRGYDKGLATGCIAASGALAIIIPPSILMIVYASLTGVSPGAMFAGGFLPGVIIAIIFSIYIGVVCYFKPHLGPPSAERFTWKVKLTALRAVIVPILIIIVVLGGIYSGFATPTEAAGIGVLAVLVSAITSKRLKTEMLMEALESTVRITVFIIWIIISAHVFSRVVETLGTSEQIEVLVKNLHISRWWILAAMEIILVILGCLIDPLGIMMITTPVFNPLVDSLGFNPLWFGVLFIVNMGAAFITPPFGINLFVVRGMVSSKFNVSMGKIISGSFPFACLYVLSLIIFILFPELILWLPSIFAAK